MSPSACRGGRSCRSSAPTARARPRSSTCSPALQAPVGRITFEGKDVTGMRPADHLARCGAAFQNIRLFHRDRARERDGGQHSRMRRLVRSILRSHGCARRMRPFARRARDARLCRSRRRNSTAWRPPSLRDQRRVDIAPHWPPIPRCAAGRAHLRMNPQESARLTEFIGAAARRAQPGHPVDRARHEGRDGRVRAHHGADHGMKIAEGCPRRSARMTG